MTIHGLALLFLQKLHCDRLLRIWKATWQRISRYHRSYIYHKTWYHKDTVQILLILFVFAVRWIATSTSTKELYAVRLISIRYCPCCSTGQVLDDDHVSWQSHMVQRCAVTEGFVRKNNDVRVPLHAALWSTSLSHGLRNTNVPAGDDIHKYQYV